MTGDVPEINRVVQDLRAGLAPLYGQIERVIVGQRVMVDRLLAGLLTGGHLLLEGVPGLAKTLAVRTLARCLDLSFHRIQFTPDLMPAEPDRRFVGQGSSPFLTDERRTTPN